jgi:phage I-like protein
MEGRPPILDRLVSARERLAAKADQFKGLERLKESLDPETYHQLKMQYRGELPDLAAAHETLIAETRQQMMRQIREQGEVEEELKKLVREEASIAPLAEIKAITPREAKRRLKQVERQKQAATEKRELYERVVAMYREALEISEAEATREV